MKLEVGDFIFAPRPRYSIEEKEFIPQLANAVSSSTCKACGDSMIISWEIVFTVHCLGPRDDRKAPRRSYQAIENYLALLCNGSPVDYIRQWCDENPLQYKIVGGYIKPINLDWQVENTSISGEVHLFTQEIDTTLDTIDMNLRVITV